jgi:ABC-2 type transport system ATP-binding protein
MNYIEEFCDSIAIINKGEIAIGGELYDIKRNYVRDRLVISSTEAKRICVELGESCTMREDGSILLHLPSPNKKGAMMRKLVERYDIDEMKVFEPSLGDIFVEYAGN